MSRSWSGPQPVPDPGSRDPAPPGAPAATGCRSIGIIGAGRVGSALGRAFLRAGYSVVGVTARSEAARRRAERSLPEVPVLEPAAVARACDILLLTVVDEAITPVAAALAASGDLTAGQYVVHTSGAHGLLALAPVAATGAVPLAIHPAMTFPGTPADADRLAGLRFAVTAPAERREFAADLVRALGGVPVWVGESDRSLYHAGLVLGANSLIAPIAAALRLLATAGIEEPAQLLGPLARAALDNALQLGDAALTGPVRRADAATIAGHVDAIAERTPEALATYRGLGVVTAARAHQTGYLTASQLRQVLTALGVGLEHFWSQDDPFCPERNH